MKGTTKCKFCDFTVAKIWRRKNGTFRVGWKAIYAHTAIEHPHELEEIRAQSRFRYDKQFTEQTQAFSVIGAELC
jgi:hypothetical protein